MYNSAQFTVVNVFAALGPLVRRPRTLWVGVQTNLAEVEAVLTLAIMG